MCYKSERSHLAIFRSISAWCTTKVSCKQALTEISIDVKYFFSAVDISQKKIGYNINVILTDMMLSCQPSHSWQICTPSGWTSDSMTLST